MSFAAAENDRRTGNLLMIGTVTAINAGAARARVSFGDLGSPELPVGQLRAGPMSFWWMPQVGEQVLVGSPSGDLAQGVIICSIFAGNAPSSDAAIPMIDLAGGTLRVNGSLEVTGDVTASGISLVTHVHTGVEAGPHTTGEPQ